MLYMPFYLLFISTVIFSSLISISSSNWIYIWMGLEINLLSFIPLMISSGSEVEVESSLKYFLVQALGSSLILLSVFSILSHPNGLFNLWCSNTMLLVSLMIKVGMFPFHYWLPHIMVGVNWFICMLLSVWQKIAPLMILSGLTINLDYWLILLMISFGSIIGGFSGINQSQMRALLAYSSIGHMSWMMFGMFYSFSMFFYYYLIYSLITISIMMIMFMCPMKLINFSNYMSTPLAMISGLLFMFLSLGGLPPLLGFYPKFMIINSCMGSEMYSYMFLLIFGALMNIFYYLSIFFNLFMKYFLSGFYSSINFKKVPSNLSLSMILILNMFLLPLMV